MTTDALSAVIVAAPTPRSASAPCPSVPYAGAARQAAPTAPCRGFRAASSAKNTSDCIATYAQNTIA